MDIWKTEMESVEWIHVAEDTDQWRDLVQTEMNILVP
jgi:hypothetical protein